uniref:ERCC4 domain-containing protein n=1 Tax=viral metagenome TaxID=1070528 RepID=A0A6C0DQW7_9ZZZZ
MKVIIDDRERDLFERCYAIVASKSTYISLSRETLPLGDIYFKTDEDKDVLMIERKSLADLLASIKDGRYEEQSYRMMHSSGFPPHSVIYIIEGQLSQLRTPLEKRLVYSAMASLNFFKGFSVIRTQSLSETAEFIIWTAEKIERNFLKGIFPYYLQPQHCKYMKQPICNNTSEENIEAIDIEECIQQNHTDFTTAYTMSNATLNASQPIEAADTVENTLISLTQSSPPNYCTVVKKVKKENVTPDNIGEIVLCQIPGISSTTAITIMKQFTTFPKLMSALAENPNVLDNITYETNGKMRKINKTSIENIKKYFL